MTGTIIIYHDSTQLPTASYYPNAAPREALDRHAFDRPSTVPIAYMRPRVGQANGFYEVSINQPLPEYNPTEHRWTP